MLNIVKTFKSQPNEKNNLFNRANYIRHHWMQNKKKLR